DQRTASAYIFGAICPKDGKGAALVMPRCDTEAMNLHLAEIATQIAPGAHAALLVDQAGWHLSGRLIVPSNITLIPFPAKCPELNPQENVWQFMRENWLSNRIFKSFDDIVGPLLRGLEQARRSTLADHVHRNARLGLQVLIIETWYKSDEARAGWVKNYEVGSGLATGGVDELRLRSTDRLINQRQQARYRSANGAAACQSITLDHKLPQTGSKHCG